MTNIIYDFLASTPWVKWRMCTRKKSYPTRSKANKQVNKINPDKLKVYECPHCFTFHIAKKKGIKDV